MYSFSTVQVFPETPFYKVVSVSKFSVHILSKIRNISNIYWPNIFILQKIQVETRNALSGFKFADIRTMYYPN